MRDHSHATTIGKAEDPHSHQRDRIVGTVISTT
jgi:hypothetical protein